MKTVFGILKRDVKALLKNPIALLVVGALLVLPGLYAWYCIVANWDPYAHTGNVPVAIVNQDKGASSSLTGEVNIGEQVVDKLHDNDSIDWRFYDDRETALADTELGVAYATIVLPENLSEDIIGIFEGSSDAPTVYYYPNEKYNAVATKVTDSAAQTLIRQVNQQFSSTVNQTLLKAVQGVADKAEGRASEARVSALAEVRQGQRGITKVIASLDDALGSIEGWKEAAAGADVALAGTADELPALRSALESGSDDLDSLRSSSSAFEGSFTGALLKAAALLGDVSTTATTSMNTAAGDLGSIGGSLDSAISALESINETFELDADITKQVDGLLENLRARRTAIDNAVQRANTSVASVNKTVQRTASNIKKASKAFARDIMPELNDGTYDLAGALTGLSAAIAQFEPQIGELRDVLAQADEALDLAKEAIGNAKGLLGEVRVNLKGTIDDLTAIGQALQVDRIGDLLDIDSANLGTFVSQPVNMETVKVFPVSNYGTAVAPFYTNLALWIGCFILVSLIKLEPDRRGFERATTTQRYFARWLLLIILSLLQSQVICGVDILLGIDCANPVLFMLAGAVCSFVYMNLIFALAITFRNIGKTLCILLLIMQVPGSSGMYPIEMMPSFFQFIHPALPFTYGITAMREALCGMYGDAYSGSICILLAVVPVSLLLGLAIRPRLMNLTQLFDQEMSATGFFASEVHGEGGDDARIMGMMKALATSDSYRDEVEERAWKFNRRYPRMRRIGSIATFAIPFVFLALMGFTELFFEPTVNTKLFWLVAMLVTVLIVQVALIVLEYVHRTVTEQTRILGLSIMNESEFASDIDELLEMTGLLLEKPDEPTAVAPDETAEPEKAEGRFKSAYSKLKHKNKKTGPARDIFLTDLRLGFHSVIGVVVLVLLVITPSLYAWFNIAGSWNPYGSTGNLKVAVANDDEGYKGDLMPVTINVGDTVVSQLRGNSNFDWQFVTNEEAIEGVRDSSYYAAIEIPSNFSRSMLTYLTDDADYPDVYYYTNEKENPIAPIITQKGADSIQESIRVSFTERVDEIALSVGHDLLEYATSPRLGDYVSKMGGHFDDAMHDMKLSATELESLSSLTGTVSGVLGSTGVALDGITTAGESAKGALGTAKEGAASATSAFAKVASLIEGMSGDGTDLDKVATQIDEALVALEKGSQNLPGTLSNASQSAAEWAGDFREIADALSDGEDSDPKLAASFKALATSFESLSASLSKSSDDAGRTSASLPDTRTDLKALLSEAKAAVNEVKSFYEDTVKPAAADLKETVGIVSDATGGIVSGLESSVGGLSSSTDGLSSQMTALSGGLKKAASKLDSTTMSLSEAKQPLAQALKSGDVKQVEAVLLGTDVGAMAQRLAAPIEEVREPIFPVANYGSSMAPFYTVLSLWVGALVMISTMRAHVAEERVEELRRRFAKVAPRHEYFGRYGIFGFVSLLQSGLVLLGDLWFLHIQCVHPVLFMLFGLFIGQVFCLIVYTLTELFGDVGKALCVILLIMQVAASGGTFPAEMLDPLLEGIVPFLPFYSAMSLLQECVAGIEWVHVMLYVLALLVTVGVMFLIGIVVRRPFRKLNDFFEEQLEKTGYM